MRADAGYIPIEARHPLRGLEGDVPDTQLDPSSATRADNIVIQDGVVKSRFGYFDLEVGETVTGDIMAVEEFELLDQSTFALVLTTTNQYYHNRATGKYINVTAVDPHTSFTITAINAATETLRVAGDQTASFPAGSRCRVLGSTDVPDAYYTVASSSFGGGSTDVVLNENITGVVGDGEFHPEEPWTSTADDYLDWVVGTDLLTHKIYITNGRDPIREWDGVTLAFEEWTSGTVAGFPSINFPTFTDPNILTCKSLEVFFDHIVLGNITVGSVNDPKNVTWSNVGDYTDFATGDSGTALIPALDGVILILKTLGDRLIIYSNDSIASTLFVGLPIVFSFEVLLQNTRLVSGRAVLSFGPAHLYSSQENIYLFDGTRGIRPIGNKVRPSYKQDFNLEFAARLFTFNDFVKRRAFVVVPDTSTTAIVYLFDYDVFDLRQFKWTRLIFTDKPTAFGFFTNRTSAPAWEDPPDIRWAWDNGVWDDEAERIGFPFRVMGEAGGATSQVFVQDETVTVDDGVVVTSTYETPDFVVPGQDLSSFTRWGEIEADLFGDEVKVSISIDHGGFFELVETVTLAGPFRRYRIPIDKVGQHLRVRFESDFIFSLRWIRVWARTGGPR